MLAVLLLARPAAAHAQDGEPSELWEAFLPEPTPDPAAASPSPDVSAEAVPPPNPPRTRA